MELTLQSPIDPATHGLGRETECLEDFVKLDRSLLLKIPLVGRPVVVFLAAMVGSFVGWFAASHSIRYLTLRDLEARAGMEREANSYVINPPFTHLRLVESGADTNDDGLMDVWSLWALEDTTFELRYKLEDVNFDGTGDTVNVEVGPTSRHFGFQFNDFDKDGSVDRTWFVISATDNSGRFTIYEDHNLDGKVDVISSCKDDKVLDRYLLHELNLYPARIYDPATRTYWVWTDQQTWKLVVLDDEQGWIPFDSGITDNSSITPLESPSEGLNNVDSEPSE